MTGTLHTATVKLPNTTAIRPLGDFLGEIVNVRNFGAIGDGVADDRAAIQAAIDYAFGTFTSPHGGAGDVGSLMYTNRALFFPAGYYRLVSPIASRAITGAANNGTGAIRLTVSTTGLASGDNINVVGITGTTEANHSWFIDVIDASHCDLRYSGFINAYVSGGTITVPCLKFRMVQGGHIYGAGRTCTRLESASDNAAVVCTYAMAYSRIENISFAANNNGVAFQLDRSGMDTNLTVNLQSNTFMNCQFGGIGGSSPAYGLLIGYGQSMGSETTILNCYTGGCSIPGKAKR